MDTFKAGLYVSPHIYLDIDLDPSNGDINVKVVISDPTGEEASREVTGSVVWDE